MMMSHLWLFSSDTFFFMHVYVRVLTAQYASMNEFTCSEHSVRIRRSKKCSTENQPLGEKNDTCNMTINLSQRRCKNLKSVQSCVQHTLQHAKPDYSSE